MDFKYIVINIPWALVFLGLIICTVCARFYIDTKHLKKLTITIEKAEYSDSYALNLCWRYIKKHPFSIYNDIMRTMMIPPSINALSDKERIKIIKDNYLYFIPEQLNDFIVFCCFILKENHLDTEYKLFIKKIGSSKKKRFLLNKIQTVLNSTVEEDIPENDYQNSPIIKSILYFNTAIEKQNSSDFSADDYFKKSLELCSFSQMKELILKRGGKIE